MESWFNVLLRMATCCAALGAAAPAADTAAAASPDSTLRPSCDSKIYCQGDLLHTIQTASLYEDSKVFIDMRLVQSPEETIQAFDALMLKSNKKPSKKQIQDFVDAYFADGDELVEVELTDWVEQPALLSRIADPALQQWASDLNAIWKDLSRQVNDTVKENGDMFSLIYVPNHFVIPGGRFKELYYWDTYWIVRGLILSDMSETVKSVIKNFLYLLDNYGIIPNGGRVYYLERTQPPMLTPMVYEYLQVTNDLQFVRENIALMEQEFNFWMNNRTVHVIKDGRLYTLAQYYAPSAGPRPESYREDYNNAQAFTNDSRQQEFYSDLKSAAESGWDFSGRWFINHGTNKGNLTDIHTKYIVPVDINAFIFWNADILSKFFDALGNEEKAEHYANIAQQWKDAVHNVLWNEQLGSWFDYDMINKKQRLYFYPSNMAPLWTKCYDQANTVAIAKKVTEYLKGQNILKYPGGVPTSLTNTGEQWDLPNAWPPMQHIVVKGLEDTQEPSAQQLAFELAQRWVASNYKAFQDTGDMFEKYDAKEFGKYGGGGEYVVQSGFGWSNGVALDFLGMYADRLIANYTPVSSQLKAPRPHHREIHRYKQRHDFRARVQFSCG